MPFVVLELEPVKRFSAHIVLALILSAFLSCGRQAGTICPEVVHINVDSVFEDLGQQIVVKRAQLAEETFVCMAQSGFNGVVLYAEQGQVLFRKAFGKRDLTCRRSDSLRVDDQFQISSDSKMFTATAIMLLRAQGKLDYDDDVRLYIPELPYEGVTIRHLLNHRSGLPRYDSMADEFWPDRTKPLSNEAMIRLFAQYKPDPYGTPDGGFFYNNVNYALLASVVERASGEHFEDFMREHVFEPLGMTRSYIYSMRDMDEVPLYLDCDVHGHVMYRKGAVKEQDYYLNGVMGDKIMFSTVDDINRFMTALDCNLLLPDSIQCEAFQPGSARWKRDENYGFGWRMSQKHPDYVYHFGWWKGYKSAVFRNVKQNQVLIVLSNTTFNIPSQQLWVFLEDTTARLPQSSWNRALVGKEILRVED